MKRYSLKIGGRTFDGGTHVMAIVNLTPDSFFADSRANGVSQALSRIGECLSEGAEIIDLGGQSTRPNCERIGECEELDRVLPVLKAAKREYPDALISVDTFYSSVARACIEAGADMINDVTCLSDPDMAKAIVEGDASVCVSHHRRESNVPDMFEDKLTGLEGAIKKLLSAGVRRDKILLDGGIGFNKSREEDIELLRRYGELVDAFDMPFLLGTSRKSLFGGDIESRLQPTLDSTKFAKQIGVLFVRVHDVKENMAVLRTE